MTLEEAQKLLAACLTKRSKWREDARQDFAFVAGHQWKEEDMKIMEDAMRPIVTFNTIAPITDAIIGHEISNRQEVSYLPRQVGAAQVNEILTAAAEWVRDECDAEQEESAAFGDAVICGEGWTDTEIDYDVDLDGRINIGQVDPLEMDVDPNSTKKNYADAKWICRSKVWDVKEAQKVWPGADIAELAPYDDKRDPQGPVDVIAAAFYVSNSGDRGRGNTGPARCIIHDFQWYENEPVYRIDVKDALAKLGPERAFVLMNSADTDGNPMLPPEKLQPDSNGLICLDADEYKPLKDLFEAAGINVMKQAKRCYYRMYFSGDSLLERKETPTKDSFTYKAMTAKRDRKNRCWYGLVRAMKDPQKWANKFMSTQLEILGTSGKGGILYEPDAFVNVRDAEQDWADPSKNIAMTEGAISANKVMPRPQTNIPEGYSRLMEYANQAINSVAGVNPEVMGLSQTLDPTGIMEEGRRQSGLNMLAYLFDGLRRYRKEQGRLLLKMITTYIPQGRLIKIVGPDGAQFVPLAYDPSVQEYDIVVDESPTAPNMKERAWNAFMSVAQNLPQMITPGTILTMLDYSPIPAAVVQKLKDQAKQAAQQPPPPLPPPVQAKMQSDMATANLRNAQAQDLQANGQRDVVIAQIDAQARSQEAQAEVMSAQAKTAEAVVHAQSAAHSAQAKVASDQMQQLNDGIKTIAQAHQMAHQTTQTAHKTVQTGLQTLQAAHKTRQTLHPKKPKVTK